jgi:hypothetical protein
VLNGQLTDIEGLLLVVVCVGCSEQSPANREGIAPRLRLVQPFAARSTIVAKVANSTSVTARATVLIPTRMRRAPRISLAR